MKAFASGVIVGASVCFVVMRIITPGEPLPAAPKPIVIPPPSSATPPRPEAGNPSVAPANESAQRNIGSKLANEHTSNRPALIPQPAPACPTATPAPLDPKQVSEKEGSDFCTRLYQLQIQREQAKKDAEPRDAGWADSMEALMRQHVESNMNSNQYSKLQIDCRTTFCELRMEGTGDAARELANQVAQDIANQSWSETIAPKGSGSNSTGAGWRITYEWFRPRTDLERRLWQRRRN